MADIEKIRDFQRNMQRSENKSKSPESAKEFKPGKIKIRVKTL